LFLTETLVTIVNGCQSQSESERCDSSNGSLNAHQSTQTRSEPDRSQLSTVTGHIHQTRAPPVPGDKDSEHTHTHTHTLHASQSLSIRH